MDQKTVLFIWVGLAAAFFVALAITPAIRRFSIRIGAVDVPKDERRMHSKPIPTIGGLAIFISFALCVAVLLKIYGGLDNKYIALLCGSLLIVVVGMLDDIYGLRWWVKLGGQICAGLVIVMNQITIDKIAAQDIGIWAVPVTILWIVAITNAINLIDGLDGLACGIVGISCISLLVVSTFSIRPENQVVTIVIAVLAGACFGFLPYNINPAKIFMGDTGAMLIGFVLSVISIQGFFKVNALVSFGVPFLVLGLPILDTLLALFRRLFKGKNPFKPDKKHLHHRLIGWGFSQRQSVALLYTISAVLGGAAILFSKGAQINSTIIAGEATSEAVIQATTPEAALEAAAQAMNSLVAQRDAYFVGAVLIVIAAFAIGLMAINCKRSKNQETTEDDELHSGTEAMAKPAACNTTQNGGSK